MQNKVNVGSLYMDLKSQAIKLEGSLPLIKITSA